MENNQVEKGACESCEPKKKHTPRDKAVVKDIQNRLNRVCGQINGIKKMVDDNRYCVDILVQIAACESALKSVGSIVLKDHLATCATEQIKAGDETVIEEIMMLIKNLR